MGRIAGEIDDTLELQFRELANKKFNYKHGAITKALEEAIKLWIKED